MLQALGLGDISLSYHATHYMPPRATTSANTTTTAAAIGPASGQNGTTTPGAARPQSGPFDWTTATSGETSHKVTCGESLWALSVQYYGAASEENYTAIALANPTVFNKKVPPEDQILHQGVTLRMLSPDRLSQIHKVQQDYGAATNAGTAVNDARNEVARSKNQYLRANAADDLSGARLTLTQARTQLNNDLRTFLLPDQSQRHQANAGDAAATELASILPDAGLKGYIDAARQSLHESLNQMFGNPTDPKSLRTDIQTGNWTAAGLVEEQKIVVAGKGITDPAKKQSACAAAALALASSGPTDPQYVAGINRAFDNVVTQPMVVSLNKLYADPQSQPHTVSGSGLDNRAGAFVKAFKADMEYSTPQVRVALLQDLLAEKNSPLLSVAGVIRTASNDRLDDRTAADLQYWRAQQPGTPSRIPTPEQAKQAGTDVWRISSKSELDQAYRDLAAGTDLAAIGDTPGTGQGMTFQFAQTLLGDPKSGSANLKVLMPSIQNAAADGNITLSVEMAGILARSPGTGSQIQASSLLDSASKGVAQLQSKIDQDYGNLQTLPKDLQVPVQSVALTFSDPQTTIDGTNSFLQFDAPKGAEVQSKLRQDLAALDRDGQAVVRVDAVIKNLPSTTLASLKGAGSLQYAGSELIKDSNSTQALNLSSMAQFQIGLEAQQQAYADAAQWTTTPGSDLTTKRGFEYLPPGVFWISRDLQSYYGQVRASGPIAPFNLIGNLATGKRLNLTLDLTGNVAQEINSLALSMGISTPNILAGQMQIAHIKDTTLVLRFGGLQAATPAATERIKTLQVLLAKDPHYKQVESLTRELAVTGDPRRRLTLLNQIGAANAESVNGQLDLMATLAKNDPKLSGEMSTLRTDYAKAQQIVAKFNAVTAGTQKPPTLVSINTWLNQAGRVAQAKSGDIGGTPLVNALQNMDPTIRGELLAGTLSDPTSTLPPEVIDALQQNETIAKALGTGPGTGLLPNTMGGTAFNVLDLVQKFGGAAYLAYLGFAHPDQDNLYKQFAAGVGLFGAVPSAVQLGAGLTQRIIGSDVSAIPGVGDAVTDLLRAGGRIDGASLFALGIGNGSWSRVLGSASGAAWSAMMYEWAAQEFQVGKPIDGLVVAVAGTSYLLPLLVDSSWAGPVGALTGIGAVGYTLYDTIVTTDHQIHQYDADIKNLLIQTGVKNTVAAALSRPDKQGLAAVVRMGQIFDAVPYYNTSDKHQNDQRRLSYLNSLSPDQANLLSQGLLNIPLDKTGHAAATGALNLAIAPPPASLGPAGIQQYYETTFRARGQQLPPDPGQIAGVGVPKNEYLYYYEMYTAGLAETGRTPDAAMLWSDLYANRNHISADKVAVFPTSIQGFMYFADAAGMSLHGATN